jgi:Uma2 family endonuclease
MAMPRVGLTYADYAALPDDGRRYEIHDGELSVTPAPNVAHQRISGNLYDVLRAHVKASGTGEVLYAPVDVILAPASVVQPDLIYIALAHAARVSVRGVEGAPTLAIEILSPNTKAIDRATKLRLYARHGVPYYWIVDPDARAIEAHELADGAYRLPARVSGDAPVSLRPFPDLALVPSSLWPSSPPAA